MGTYGGFEGLLARRSRENEPKGRRKGGVDLSYDCHFLFKGASIAVMALDVHTDGALQVERLWVNPELISEGESPPCERNFLVFVA